MPNEFRGISFHVWLDIFLEYAIALAQSGDRRQAYDVVTSASNANVFYHSPDSMFLIHVSWFSKFFSKSLFDCAKINSDHYSLCSYGK